MPAEIPPALKPLFEQYIAALQSELPGYMSACYVHGSLALGEFQPRWSDVDFITVIGRRSTEADIAALKRIHNSMKSLYPRDVLSGSYLQAADLGCDESAIEPYPFYQDGALNSRGHHDINDVTWWILKEKGILIAGIPQAIPFEMDWDAFSRTTLENLNSYWVRFVRDPTRIIWLLSDQGIQWVIPGVLRQFYTISEHAITSKTGACDYGLAKLPERWHRIVQEARDLRNERPSGYGSRYLLALEAWQFLRDIIQRCNAVR